MTIHNALTTNPVIPVSGTYNFRDLGGIPLRGGGSIARGRVYRSDGLQGLDEAGRAHLAELGVTRLIDLRRAEELERMPSAVDPAAVEIVHVPIFDEAAPDRQAEQLERLDLAVIYDVMIATRGRQFAAAAEQIARTPGGVVFHCAAGKDRTGVLAALILDAVGAERDAVIADYAATAANLAGEWAERMLAGQDIPALEAAGIDIVGITTQSPAALIEEILARVDAEYGGGAAYLTTHGLPADALEALRAKLVGRG